MLSAVSGWGTDIAEPTPVSHGVNQKLWSIGWSADVKPKKTVSSHEQFCYCPVYRWKEKVLVSMFDLKFASKQLQK